MDIKKEVEKFKQTKEEDDNAFLFYYDWAKNQAWHIQQRMDKACAELRVACYDNTFGRDFTESIMRFSEESDGTQQLADKLEEDKEHLIERGLSKHPTNMTVEQVKTLLPTLNGDSSLTVVDALDTYRKRLSKSGINRAVWGSVVLSKIEGQALARLPAEVKRDQSLEKIEEHLRFFYQSSLVATKAIMQAHELSGPIPDPHHKPLGSLKVLQIHAEVQKHSDRYLMLTPEETAASNLMSGENVERLLNLLPQRVRMDTEGLSKVELDENRRKV